MGITHPQRLGSPSPERYSSGLIAHRQQTPQRSFQRGLAGTHATPAPNCAHSGLHGETRGVSDGGGITTLGAFRTFANLPGPGIRTAYFAAFGAWSDVLLKNAESLRDSDALMRVAVPRRRGPAGLRDPIAVSLTAPMGFTFLFGHSNRTQRTYLPVSHAGLLHSLCHSLPLLCSVHSIHLPLIKLVNGKLDRQDRVE